MNKFKLTPIFIFLFFFITQSLADSLKPNDIYKNIRCLVCQGQSVADSNSEFAQTIKLVVLDKIDKGNTEQEIYKFLVDKYGDWIIYDPPFNKINFLLWTLPYIIFLLGGILIFLIIKKRGKT